MELTIVNPSARWLRWRLLAPARRGPRFPASCDPETPARRFESEQITRLLLSGSRRVTQ
jgi:hypothetical protein